MKNKKKWIAGGVAALLVIVIAAGIFGGWQAWKKQQRDQRIALGDAYWAVNEAFRTGGEREYAEGKEMFHQREWRLTLEFAFYKKETGREMTFEKRTEYLAQQYEEDGSLRLYNNGLHPEIEQYVEWDKSSGDTVSEYVSKLIKIFYDDIHDTDGTLLSFDSLADSPIWFLEELMKKEADPGYEMQYDPAELIASGAERMEGIINPDFEAASSSEETGSAGHRLCKAL